MNFFNMVLSVAAPEGMWANLINWINGSVANYAVAIILLTLLIKTCILPIDLVQRIFTTRNSKMMANLKPKLDALNKKYANNPQMLNQETMKLYKKENYNVFGSLGIMVVYMVITCVVFFTLFGTLNDMVAYKMNNEFEILQDTYITAYNEKANELGIDEYSFERAEGVTLNDEAKEYANSAVQVKYDDIKESFLWIKNIWGKDTSSSVVLSYDDFVKYTKQSTNVENENYVNPVLYQDVMTDSLSAKYEGQWNGYYILCILAALVTFLSTKMTGWVSKLRAKKKGQVYVDPMAKNKFMLFLMPAIMAIFTLFYTAAFAIYIVIGAMFSLVINPIMTIIIEVIEEKIAAKKQKNKPKVSYSR